METFERRLNDDLTLRLVDPSDAEELARLIDINRASLRKWLPWLDYSNGPADSLKFIKTSLEKHASNRAFEAVILFRGEITGLVGFHPIDWTNRIVNVGYWMAEEYRGRGFVIEATRAMVNYAFKELELNRVEINCATENLKSQAIPLALGFKEEGVRRDAEWLYDHFVDHKVFAMLAAEWPQKDVIK